MMCKMATDEEIEPPLQPVVNRSHLKPGSNVADGARLDVSTWGTCLVDYSKHFLMFEYITNPNSPSKKTKKFDELYTKQERGQNRSG